MIIKKERERHPITIQFKRSIIPLNIILVLSLTASRTRAEKARNDEGKSLKK